MIPPTVLPEWIIKTVDTLLILLDLAALVAAEIEANRPKIRHIPEMK